MKSMKHLFKSLPYRTGLRSAILVPAILLACITGQQSVELAHAYTLPEDDGTPALSTPELSHLNNISKGLAALAAESKKALVFISTSQIIDANDLMEGCQGIECLFLDPRLFPRGPQKQQGSGSGFFVDLEKGYIITNNHVVEDADTINLKLDNGQTYKGEIVGKDSTTDVAVVKVKDAKFNRENLSELVLHEGEVEVGELTLALGAPFGLESSISFGVVSAKGRTNMKVTQLGSFIQTDAAINRGNSGGPLLNMDGQVIGINTFIASPSGGSVGVGFSIPSSLARSRAQQLITHGKVERGYIGLSLQNLDESMVKALGLPEEQRGVLVGEVIEGGPAEKAGLAAGDIVIALDGKPIKESSEIILNVGTKSPKSVVRLTVLRDGKKRTFRLSVASWPDSDGSKSVGSSKDGKKGDSSEYKDLGMSVTPLNSELRRRNKIKSSTGYMITKIERGKLADESGLQVGDVLISINKTPLTSNEVINKLVDQKSFVIRLEREGIFLFVAINRESS